MTDPGRTVAAIDIGSNTIKLTVADVAGGAVSPRTGRAEVVRLSEGLGETGRLREDRIDHAIKALGQLVNFARAANAGLIVAVATEATRSASNGPAFLARVSSEVGIEVQVIDGAEEARLTSEGVLSQIDPAGSILIVDIGGGSTELIETRDGAVLDSVSFTIGSGVMTDTYVAADPPAGSELDQIEQISTERAGPFLHRQARADRMVLVGGVGTYLLAVSGQSGRVGSQALDEARRIVLAMTAAELAPVVNAPVARARVLPAGFAIARSLNRLAGAPTIESVANGLRIGLLLRMARPVVREESSR